MTDPTGQTTDSSKSGASTAVSMWLAACVTFLCAACFFANPEMAAVFASLEVDLPAVTAWGFFLGAWLRTGLGVVITLGLLALSVTPFLLGARGRGATRVYRAFSVVTFLAAALLWFAGPMPIQKLQQLLGPMAPPAKSR